MHRSINSPLIHKFGGSVYQFPFRIDKFKDLCQRRCIGWCLTNDMVAIDIIMVLVLEMLVINPQSPMCPYFQK